jgi:hypothetical protein
MKTLKGLLVLLAVLVVLSIVFTVGCVDTLAPSGAFGFSSQPSWQECTIHGQPANEKQCEAEMK